MKNRVVFIVVLLLSIAIGNAYTPLTIKDKIILKELNSVTSLTMRQRLIKEYSEQRAVENGLATKAYNEGLHIL